MLEQIDQALCAIQTALISRELYDDTHPAVLKSRSEAMRLLGTLLSQSSTIQLMAIDHRVVVQGQTLPSSALLSNGLFARLRKLEFDGLIFRRGVTADELTTLLKCLAPTAGTEVFPKLQGIAPVRVDETGDSSYCPTGAVSAPGAAISAPRRTAPRGDAAIMAPMLSQIVVDGSLDNNALSNVVSNINAIVRGAEDTIIPLASLKQHDEYTYVHTINVGLLAAALAEAVGISGERLIDLTSAALLHDVGKRLVPIGLLNKPGKLSEDEYRCVQSHPELGAKLLLGMPGLPPIVPIVAYEHHMCRTGGGYPKVPPGWKMHLGSQIVQIADVFDALRTHRRYRAALPLEKVREVMSEDTNGYDSDLLRVFLDKVACNTDREVADDLIPPAAAEAA